MLLHEDSLQGDVQFGETFAQVIDQWDEHWHFVLRSFPLPDTREGDWHTLRDSIHIHIDMEGNALLPLPSLFWYPRSQVQVVNADLWLGFYLKYEYINGPPRQDMYMLYVSFDTTCLQQGDGLEHCVAQVLLILKTLSCTVKWLVCWCSYDHRQDADVCCAVLVDTFLLSDQWLIGCQWIVWCLWIMILVVPWLIYNDVWDTLWWSSRWNCYTSSALVFSLDLREWVLLYDRIEIELFDFNCCRRAQVFVIVICLNIYCWTWHQIHCPEEGLKFCWEILLIDTGLGQ